MKNILSVFSLREAFHSLLSRPRANYHCLDGLRAMAVLWVIVLHVGMFGVIGNVDAGGRLLIESAPFLLGWIYNGNYGVDVFFVLSGFLIASIIFKEIDASADIHFVRFYMRRILRLSPALIVLAILSYSTNLYYHGNLWYNVFYVSNFFPILDISIPWTWSLAIEEQFYLLFPLVALLVKKRKLAIFIGLFLFAIGIRLYIVLDHPDLLIQANQWLPPNDFNRPYFSELYVGLHVRFGALVCGVIALLLYRYHRHAVEKFFNCNSGKMVMFVLLAAFGFIAVINLNRSEVILSNIELYLYHVLSSYILSLSVAATMLAMLVGTAYLRPLQVFLSLKIWYPIAQLAYGLYLFHFFALSFSRYLFENILMARNETFNLYNHFHMLSILLLTLVGSAIIAGLVYVTVERPFMNLRDKLPVSSSRPPVIGGREQTQASV